jgi:FkbM family methyltransferase
MGLRSAPWWVRLAARCVPHLPAGRYRAMAWLRRPRPRFWMQMPLECGGYWFTCDLRDTVASEVCFTGQYEPQETALVTALLKPGMTFVDVGANWGYFTLLAAHLVGSSGRVISLEPDPRLFQMLSESVAHNKLHQVTTLQIAAAGDSGMFSLAGYDERGGNFGLSRLTDRVVGPDQACCVEQGPASCADRRPVFSVVGQTLDALFEENKLGNVDLLKMDIEGSEGLGLSGLVVSLHRQRVKRLLLELHPGQLAEHGHSCASVLGRLREAGYQVFSVDHSAASTRRAAYAQKLDAGSLLHPLEPDAPLDSWPHVLCTAPGTDLLP